MIIDYSGDREGPTTLPQDPKADKAARLKQLEERREDYRWSTEVIVETLGREEGAGEFSSLPRQLALEILLILSTRC